MGEGSSGPLQGSPSCQPGAARTPTPQPEDRCGPAVTGTGSTGLWLRFAAPTAPEHQGAQFARGFVLSWVGSPSWRCWETQCDLGWKNMLRTNAQSLTVSLGDRDSLLKTRKRTPTQRQRHAQNRFGNPRPYSWNSVLAFEIRREN